MKNKKFFSLPEKKLFYILRAQNARCFEHPWCAKGASEPSEFSG